MRRRGGDWVDGWMDDSHGANEKLHDCVFVKVCAIGRVNMIR